MLSLTSGYCRNCRCMSCWYKHDWTCEYCAECKDHNRYVAQFLPHPVKNYGPEACPHEVAATLEGKNASWFPV